MTNYKSCSEFSFSNLSFCSSFILKSSWFHYYNFLKIIINVPCKLQSNLKICYIDFQKFLKICYEYIFFTEISVESYMHILVASRSIASLIDMSAIQIHQSNYSVCYRNTPLFYRTCTTNPTLHH